MLDEATLQPRPDYWTTVLHKRLVGTRVLDARSNDPLLRVYAHCTRAGALGAGAGAVTFSVLNIDRERAADLELVTPGADEAFVFVLSAPAPTAKIVSSAGRSSIRTQTDRCLLSSRAVCPPIAVGSG